MRERLTHKSPRNAARDFSEEASKNAEPSLFGITDGKAVGTFVEHRFREYLKARFEFEEGNSARGIDFPEIEVDMKVTSIRQPQSSCPFKSARQKIHWLGYALLVFVYEKTDDQASQTSRLNILHTIFVEKERTADFQTTSGIRQILENNGNEAGLLAFFEERMLPVDPIEAEKIVAELMQEPPRIGFLTISNALQWRLQYTRAIEKAGQVEGVIRVSGCDESKA